jgi:hypothetical protein
MDGHETMCFREFVAGPNHSMHFDTYEYLSVGKYEVAAVADGVDLWVQEITVA